jgi:DNA binding domain, excisionase family
MKSPENPKTGCDFEGFVSIETLMERLGVPKKTIYKWSYEHLTTGFPSYKIGRHLKFRFSEVEIWLKKFHRKS